MSITPRELETFAARIASRDFNIDSNNGIRELIGHLDPDDYDTVLARAAEMVRGQIGAAREPKSAR